MPRQARTSPSERFSPFLKPQAGLATVPEFLAERRRMTAPKEL